MNLLKNILISTKTVYHFKIKKNNDLTERKSSEFKTLDKKVMLIIEFISTKLKEVV